MGEKNLGLIQLNGDCAQLKNKTVIVLGAARGGTSMVSGTLVKLGIYMGENISPLYEDEYLSKHIDNLAKTEINTIIKARNSKYAVWGIKKPSLKLLSIRNLFREPVYIVVFRDIFVTANRRVISKNQTLLTEMFKSYCFYLRILLFLKFTKRPALLVSYEKALLDPESLVLEIANFLNLDKQVLDYSNVAEFIQSSPETYTNHQRFLGDWTGYVEIINVREVSGWAVSKTDFDLVLTLELVINNVCVMVTKTNFARADVKVRHADFNENCGFKFVLSEANSLSSQDTVEVRIFGANIFLKKTIQHSDI